MKQPKHWQDAVNAILGAWLVLSPWAAGYSGYAVAGANAVVIGTALVAAALGAMLAPQAWEEWTEAALGLWLMVSPWGLGFDENTSAMLAALITGAVVLSLALWTLAIDKDYSAGLWHRKAH